MVILGGLPTNGNRPICNPTDKPNLHNYVLDSHNLELFVVKRDNKPTTGWVGKVLHEIDDYFNAIEH